MAHTKHSTTTNIIIASFVVLLVVSMILGTTIYLKRQDNDQKIKNRATRQSELSACLYQAKAEYDNGLATYTTNTRKADNGEPLYTLSDNDHKKVSDRYSTQSDECNKLYGSQ